MLLTAGDIFSDLYLTVTMTTGYGKRKIWGYCPLIPLIFNYILTWFAGCRLNDNSLLLLTAGTWGCYPSF